jgi:hypothetical protein
VNCTLPLGAEPYLELPVIGIFNRLDGPVEFLPQGLREKLLDRDIELFGKDDSQTRIDVVLGQRSVCCALEVKVNAHNLASTKRNLLVALSVNSLELHCGDAFVNLLYGGL